MANFKGRISKGTSTNWSNNFFAITEISHDTISQKRIDFLPETSIETFLRSKI